MADDTKLSAQCVQALARQQDHRGIDDVMAGRIAVGADHAVRAVADLQPGSLFDTEPADYLVELERLADAGTGAGAR